MADTPGLEYAPNLKIGVLELEWLQEEIHRLRRYELQARMLEPGLFVSRHAGGEPAQWGIQNISTGIWLYTRDLAASGRFFADVGPNSLSLPSRIALGMDAVGDPIELVDWESTSGVFYTGLDLTDDGIWYTLTVENELVAYEKGTVTVVTGSKTLTGTGTSFTRLQGKSDNGFRGDTIRIDAGDSANGNEGEYEVDSITNDTTLVLVDAINGTTESDIDFSISGDFTASPAVVADRDIHLRKRAKFRLVAKTLEPAADQFILADVKYDTGASSGIQVIDRREANMYRELVGPEYAHQGYLATEFGTTVNAHDPSGHDVLDHDMADTSDGLIYVGQLDDGSGSLIVKKRFWNFYQDNTNVAWLNPAKDAVTVTIATGLVSTAPGCAIEALPEVESLITSRVAYNTHVAAYIKSNKVVAKFTTDEGSTWGAEFDIIDPTSVDVNDRVYHPDLLLTRQGRLICIFCYFDDSASKYDIRYAFSDDYGDTWDSNTNAGYSCTNTGAGTEDYYMPRIAQGANGELVVSALPDKSGASGSPVWDTGNEPILWRGKTNKDPAMADADDWDHLTTTATYGGATVWNTSRPSQVAASPAIHVFPNGAILGVYANQENSGPSTDLWYAVMGRGADKSSASVYSTELKVMFADSLKQVSGASGVGNCACRLHQDKNGTIHLLWLSASSDRESKHTMLQCIPQRKVPRHVNAYVTRP